MAKDLIPLPGNNSLTLPALFAPDPLGPRIGYREQRTGNRKQDLCRDPRIRLPTFSCLSCFWWLPNSALVSPASNPSRRAVELRVSENYGKLPLSFEPNQGQASSEVKFLARGNGYTLLLNSTEAVFTLQKSEGRRKKQSADYADYADISGCLSICAICEICGRFCFAHEACRCECLSEDRRLRRTARKTNYFLGNDPAKWRKK